MTLNELMKVSKDFGCTVIDTTNDREDLGCVNVNYFEEIINVYKYKDYKDYEVQSISLDSECPQHMIVEIKKSIKKDSALNKDSRTEDDLK